MSMRFDAELMTYINQIDEQLASVRGLSDLGPLLDAEGARYFEHAILLLSLIEDAAISASEASSALTRHLRGVQP